MLEFIFDTTRTVSHLVFTGTLLRYPDIEWVVTHGGGALPLLADRMELFRTVFVGDDDPHSTLPRQLRGLWFDIAGTPFPHQVPAAVAAFGTERLLYGSDYCLDAGPRSGRTACIDSASRSACRRQLAGANHPQRQSAAGRHGNRSLAACRPNCHLGFRIVSGSRG
jgi:6-methylsalicylate decarboxylase